ncbi:LOW QUALITY PROTEIN: protein spaetzle 4-like [Homalodisca vitripennis]|uniref:LOW QUALITY PROTEIN: protein spaetzle 4-like n=1 Tax=Homalodisca vitripennis TaxID=197043 RepID=UPI001EEB03CB|nr:LOW QUALITY PROTEIN: protein spaetzle 4-like [Homalodisca vitripennis]
MRALPLTFSLLVFGLSGVPSRGYDAGYTTCSKPFRSSKSRSEIPCDFRTQTWCTIPGTAYPWRAVRRFVYENHGLMRRMYGDERHISVLRSEIESNDVEYQSDSGWSFHDSILKNYKPRPESVPSSTSTTTTTAEPSTRPSTQEPATESANPYTLSSSELFTTDINLDTTAEYESTTVSEVQEKSQPVHQPELFEKDHATTEETQMYKLRGVNACPVKEEVVAPFWANNTRGEVLALLNLYPFEQYVHWERCTFENKQMFCRQGCRCEQQYRLHRLLAYDPSNDCRGIFSDWFKFPSCCVCRCYDLPSELRLTSRSPRFSKTSKQDWDSMNSTT